MVGGESGTQNPSGLIRQTDNMASTLLCCLKKKHTAQGWESAQEKAHSNALEDSTEEEQIQQKEDFKIKVDKMKGLFSWEKKK